MKCQGCLKKLLLCSEAVVNNCQRLEKTQSKTVKIIFNKFMIGQKVYMFICFTGRE